MVDKNNVGYEVDSSLLGEKLIFPSSKREARNRFLKAAMSEKLCFFDKDNQQISGIPTQRLINLYSKWAHGGFGMILTGNLMVDINHPECAGNTIIEKVLDSKERRDAFKKLADTMKSGGALAIAQLSHAGRMTSITINEHPFSASDIQFKGKKNGQGFGVPIPLTEEQIRTEVIARFVYAAKFCQEAGQNFEQL
uniref:NADH:flavin oxidoreductase/NADH oxidase N-terminal domain-containing protein n=1 Tax=Acrobeloides nanus TaxID=290746 RepID=A0A914DMM7_9BILA